MKTLHFAHRGTFTVGLAVVIAVFVLVLPTMASAKTLYVSTSGNDANTGLLGHPVRTVQKAIDLAVSGDAVEVGAGTFSGDVTMTAGVSLFGAGASNTTLQGTGKGQVVWADNVGASATISGFTITGGGDGIDCYNSSSPRITNDIVTGNNGDDGIRCDFSSSPTIMYDTISSGSGGDGIGCIATSSPVIANDTISGNHYIGIECADSSAPNITNDVITGNGDKGIECDDSSSPTVTNDTISGNSNDGIYCDTLCSPSITNDTITGNSNDGVYCNASSSPTVTNDTISGNNGDGVHASDNSTPTITNCIVWDNTGLELYQCPSTYSDVATPVVGTNIDADPSFVAAGSGDFHLKATSPCIDTGTSLSAPATDKDGIHRPQGAGFDMGAYEYHITVATKTKLSVPSSVTVKHSLKLSGTVSPSAASGLVSITMSHKVKGKLTVASKRVRLNTGKFSYSFKPKSTGTWSFAATYTGYADNKDATVYAVSMSKAKTVKVKAKKK